MAARMHRTLHLMLVAGELSGDALGAALMGALKVQTGGAVRFSGIGGPAMEANGLTSLFPMQDLSVMGIAEILPRLPRLLRRLREAEDHALASGPDAVITIDSPGFNFRLARRLCTEGLTLIHYVAPTVWAWRPGRAKKIAPLFDHLLTLLPFEPPLFAVEGLRSTFVGHPVIESGAAGGDGAGFRARHGISAGAPVVCVLPGSRGSETSRLLAPFGETAQILSRELRGLIVVVAAVPHLDAAIRTAVAAWGVPSVVVGPAEKYDAMAASDAALAASGTVALELALARVPTVVAYRVHPLTYWIVRALARAPYIHLVNVVLNRPVVPELLQGDCRPDKLAAAVGALLRDPALRGVQIEAALSATAALTPPRGSPSAAAAEAVLGMIASRIVPAKAPSD